MIVTERLLLRPFEAEDLSAFVDYRRVPEVAAYQSWDTDYSLDAAEAFLAEQAELVLGTRGAWVQTAIADRAEPGRLLGDCASHVLAEEPRTAEVGITLAPAGHGRGIGREALGALVAALFDDHGMHRVYAQADDRNVAAHRLLESLGLRCEARLVEAHWFKGEWTSLRVYAQLARER